MSNYQYQKGNRNNSDLTYWIIAIVLIMSGIAAPIGFLMIVAKLLSGKKRSGRSGTTYTRRSDAGPVGARTTSPKAAPELTTEARNTQLAALERKGRTLTIVGAVLTAVFLFTSISSASNAFYWLLHGDVIWFLEDMMNLLPIFCFLGGGAGCLLVGLRRQKKVRRFRQYLAMIGRRTSISLASLASATGASPAKIRDDLEDMLDENLFPNGYLDLGSGMLVVSGEGLDDSPKEEPKQPEQPKQETPQDAVLEEIRAVNDAIDNPRLSQQIDRIGVITAKILDYQRQHPDKSPQLHSFLSYYLPTTLKILNAYDRMDAAGISGENIDATKKKVEQMMATISQAFDRQLDALFGDEALDISTDITVMEQMLQREGLGGQKKDGDGGVTLEL